MSDSRSGSASALPCPRIVGTGPICVFVAHGWIADRTLFDPCLGWIDRERYTFALADCRGYGTRRDEADPCTIEAMAHDVLAAAEVLGWRRFHLLGHSMGGMVAQRLMIDAPERLASSLLLAPVPASGAQPNATRRELLRRAIADPAVRRELIDANSGGNRPLAWVDHLLQLSLATTRPAALAAYLDAWADTDFSREITPAAMPVLVLIGDHDPGATRSRMAETLLRWHPHARLEVLPGIGHYPMQESPAELWTAIARFVSAATA